jgi:hypothetical protein
MRYVIKCASSYEAQKVFTAIASISSVPMLVENEVYNDGLLLLTGI